MQWRQQAWGSWVLGSSSLYSSWWISDQKEVCSLRKQAGGGVIELFVVFLLFFFFFFARWLCCSNGEQPLYGEGECSFSLFLSLSSVNSSPRPRSTCIFAPLTSVTVSLHLPHLLLCLRCFSQQLKFYLLCHPTVSFSSCLFFPHLPLFATDRTICSHT